MRHKPGAVIPVYPSETTATLAEKGPYDQEKGIRNGPYMDGATIEKDETVNEVRPADPMYNQTKDDYDSFQHATHPFKPKGRQS